MLFYPRGFVGLFSSSSWKREYPISLPIWKPFLAPYCPCKDRISLASCAIPPEAARACMSSKVVGFFCVPRCFVFLPVSLSRSTPFMAAANFCLLYSASLDASRMNTNSGKHRESSNSSTFLNIPKRNTSPSIVARSSSSQLAPPEGFPHRPS